MCLSCCELLGQAALLDGAPHQKSLLPSLHSAWEEAGPRQNNIACSAWCCSPRSQTRSQSAAGSTHPKTAPLSPSIGMVFQREKVINRTCCSPAKRPQSINIGHQSPPQLSISYRAKCSLESSASSSRNIPPNGITVSLVYVYKILASPALLIINHQFTGFHRPYNLPVCRCEPGFSS